jgi:hypothetical protein
MRGVKPIAALAAVKRLQGFSPSMRSDNIIIWLNAV